MKKDDIRKYKFMFVLFIIILLLLISVYFLLRESGYIKNENVLIEKNFSIEDKCSIIVGKIVHPIDREDECINKCIAQCETYSLAYLRAEFESKQDNCNMCKCFCD